MDSNDPDFQDAADAVNKPKKARPRKPFAAPPAIQSPAYDPLMTFKEVIAYARTSDPTLRRAVSEREIACVRNGARGHLKFRLSAVNAWIRKQEVAATRVSLNKGA